MSLAGSLLEARIRGEGEPHTFSSLDGTVTLYVNAEEECYFIEAKFEHDPRWLSVLRDQAENWGLEPLSEDECPAKITETGIRVWYAEKVPIPRQQEGA